MKARILTVQPCGDFHRQSETRRVHVSLNLAGWWLNQAGFEPGAKVEVSSPEPGVLTIRLLTPPHPLAQPISPATAPPVIVAHYEDYDYQSRSIS